MLLLKRKREEDEEILLENKTKRLCLHRPEPSFLEKSLALSQQKPTSKKRGREEELADNEEPLQKRFCRLLLSPFERKEEPSKKRKRGDENDELAEEHQDRVKRPMTLGQTLLDFMEYLTGRSWTYNEILERLSVYERYSTPNRILNEAHKENLQFHQPLDSCESYWNTMPSPKIPWWSIPLVFLAAVGITILFQWVGTPDQVDHIGPPRSRPPNPYINATHQCTFGVLPEGGQNIDYSNLNCSQVVDAMGIEDFSDPYCIAHNPWVGTNKGMDAECFFPCTTSFGLTTNTSEEGTPMDFFNRSDATFPVYLNFTNGSMIVRFLHHYTLRDPLNALAPDPSAPLTVDRTFWNQPNGTFINDPKYYIHGGELTAQLLAFYMNVYGNLFFIPHDNPLPKPLAPYGTSNASRAEQCFGSTTALDLDWTSITNILFRFLAYDNDTTDTVDYYCFNMPDSCRDMFAGLDNSDTHDDARITFYTRMVTTLQDYNHAFPHCIDKKTMSCFVLKPFVNLPF